MGIGAASAREGINVAVRFVVKPSQYFDSVSLMNIAAELQRLAGIEDAALVMGTTANKTLLEAVAPLTPQVQAAKPTDLIVLLVGEESALPDALVTTDRLLTDKPIAINNSNQSQPRTLRTAQRMAPHANLVMISVAGEHAVAEAWTALQQELNVFLFSDNVALDDEYRLKSFAVEHRLLLMGPGAGTAIINGIGLGFANQVPRGPVGIVSAAGTGLQEVSSILAQHGVGVSQAIGVGGRDLSEIIGGLMTFHAIDALQADPQTEVIVAISKLPAPRIAQQVMDKLATCGKPSVVIFMSDERTSPLQGVHVTETLEDAACLAASLATGRDIRPSSDSAPIQVRFSPSQRYLRGLFSGGTLCEEAMRLWSRHVGDVWSNGPLLPQLKLPDSHHSYHHCAIDLGEEEFTLGRPHPMIDNTLRIQRLLQESHDPQVAVIQMDVVLGYGAHPNPAAELGPAIAQARNIAQLDNRDLAVIVSITGTPDDPQNYAQQKSLLEASGTIVVGSNAAASRLAVAAINRVHL